jgi:flagellar secretion chaperone FliS
MSYTAYANVQTATADPARLVLLMFDGAIRFLRRALKGLEAGHAGEFAENLSRAHAIIAELDGSLDQEVGGAIAVNLARLYEFMLLHLTRGLIARDRSHVERVLGLLETLKSAFDGAVEAQGREPVRR